MGEWHTGSDIRSEWHLVEIGGIAQVVGGSTPSTKDPTNFGGDIPWITPKDLSGPHDRYVTGGKRNLTRKGLASCSAKLVPPGTVLLTTRAPVGYVAIAGNQIATNQGFRNLILRDGVSPGFVYYWLKANTEELLRHASGSTFTELSGSSLKQIHMLLPEESEQRAIAHILGTLDDKIELNRRMNETLEEMARAIFKSWFVDFDPVRAKMDGSWRRGESLPGMPAEMYDLFPERLVDSELGEIPEGWEVKALDEIANFRNGLALQKLRPKENEERLPVVKIAQLRSGKADSDEWATTSITPECIIDDGDIIFSWSGSLLVKVWCGGRAALNQHLFKVTSRQYPKWFYLHCTQSHLPEFQRIAADKATTMGHIKRHHLSEARCVIPNQTLLSAVDDTFVNFLSKCITINVESRTLADLRDTLLPKLISGELRVRDAEGFVESVV